ncbi:MAG: GDSL-type esterase/lipase family protein [Eubacteriales bacterium]|nr:GDSL-type esterase/lipase family protein [Eubacteriales bacterium]
MKAFLRCIAVVVLAFAMLLSLIGCSAPTAVEAIPVAVPANTAVAPSNTPAAAPTATAAVATPAPTATPAPPPPGDRFYDAFFDDAVFVGDSITQGLQNYVIHLRKDTPSLLGTARFAAAKSFNLERACFRKAPSDGALRYKGKAMTIPGIMTAMDVHTVYIMLGVNDWAGSHIDDCIENYATLIARILEAVPDAVIYVQSCTPVTQKGEKAKLTNVGLDAFNVSLRALCEQTGARYVDISTALKDETNCLNPAYSSDNYVHMSKEGAEAWIGALYQYAYEAYVSGAWEGPEERN